MKDKIIEAMAKIIRADYKEWLDVTGCIPQGTSYYSECLGGALDCAELLYNAGYRKIPENAVVVPRAEYNDLKGLEKHFDDYLIKEIVDARKETAEKFAERLKEYSITEYKEFGALRFYKISYPQLDELVEEMTK